MFLPMLLTEGVHQHTALPDRQMYIGDHHVHVTSRGSGNQWPQHLCLAPVQVITCS
ncbi:GPATCH2L isoform 8, partial [Pongo abelii]